MSLADIVRQGIVIANSVTLKGRLQEMVTLYRWKGNTTYGQPDYAAGLQLQAIVTYKARRVRLTSGAETVSAAQVTFLAPFDALTPAPAGRDEPIDKRDKIKLASGLSGPILQTDGGLADPKTGRPFLVTAYLGG